eukprot:5678373-Pyramimonas_sp.AAC.1
MRFPTRARRGAVETHAKERPACLQGALGFVGCDGFATEAVTFQHQGFLDAPGLRVGCLVG